MWPLNNPAWWLAVGCPGRARPSWTLRRNRLRRLLVRLPAAISETAVGVTVAILLSSLTAAPIRQVGGYSIGAQNLAAAEDGSCGIADHVVNTPVTSPTTRYLAEPPTYLVNPPAGLGFGGTAAYEPSIGGARETGTWEAISTRLVGAGKTPDYTERRHLIVVDYPMPGNGWGVRSVPVPRWGWRGE